VEHDTLRYDAIVASFAYNISTGLV